MTERSSCFFSLLFAIPLIFALRGIPRRRSDAYFSQRRRAAAARHRYFSLLYCCCTSHDDVLIRPRRASSKQLCSRRLVTFSKMPPSSALFTVFVGCVGFSFHFSPLSSLCFVALLLLFCVDQANMQQPSSQIEPFRFFISEKSRGKVFFTSKSKK